MVEHGNQAVNKHTTAILHKANLPSLSKALAVTAYTHVANMYPSSHIPNSTTPYKLWNGKKPNMSYLCGWNYLVYIHAE